MTLVELISKEVKERGKSSKVIGWQDITDLGYQPDDEIIELKNSESGKVSCRIFKLKEESNSVRINPSFCFLFMNNKQSGIILSNPFTYYKRRS